MDNVVRGHFPGDSKPPTGDGGGPEDPMLEQRVGKLEEKVDRIESILSRLEPKITEILLTSAKQADLNKLQLEVAEIKLTSAKQVELNKVQNDIVEIKGKLTGIEGRFTGLDYRINSLPTVWTMLGIVFTTWALGSGILIFAMNYLRK
jgi:hypothetical protein